MKTKGLIFVWYILQTIAIVPLGVAFYSLISRDWWGGDVCLVLGCFHFELVEVHQGGSGEDTLYIIIRHKKCALTGSERILTYKHS